jgi:DNA-binding IclR family transcriptional regulator
LSIEDRRTKAVYAVIEALVRDGQADFRPGDVTAAMRKRGQPLGAWEVRRELSTLEADGLIELDPETGFWSLTAAASKKATG